MAERQPKDSSGEDNSALLDQYIDCAKKFIDLAKELGHIKGANKLQRMCKSELKYLQSLRKIPTLVCGNHLKSSNLSHFAGCLHAAYNAPGVVQILCPFSMTGRTENLVVDVVANQGHTWVKVIARKAQALHLIWAGRGQFGERDLVRQAKDYLRCAAHHPVNFQKPKVHFAFYNQVTIQMAACLEKLGVSVSGDRVPVDEGTANQINMACLSSDEDSEDEPCPDNDISGDDDSDVNQDDFSSHTEGRFEGDRFSIGPSADLNCDITTSTSRLSKNDTLFSEMNLIDSLISCLPRFDCLTHCAKGNDSEKVNLDITTLITLVSSVTHGGCQFEFPEKILAQQATEERQEPVLPKLRTFLQGKTMYVCRTALEDFQSILDTLGGQKEKERAKELLSRVTIVDDDPSDRTTQMPYSLKIKERSKVIFGTGDKLQAVTVTANSSFVRAAQHQGVSYAVHLHPSRALTEEKEKSAVPLPSSE
ncbi:UPF0415 protein C7orf25 homolog [Saccostrea echinata]|uniref:UPF0415 protein C7orf25 homolog n=1 Tax=Saccostrea echinata TaxID=191078 RepID=UPI002A81B76B|nr:UPF0415 protein C7orf25 homolog [Saccostrea echinata]